MASQLLYRREVVNPYRKGFSMFKEVSCITAFKSMITAVINIFNICILVQFMVNIATKMYSPLQYPDGYFQYSLV